MLEFAGGILLAPVDECNFVPSQKQAFCGGRYDDVYTPIIFWQIYHVGSGAGIKLTIPVPQECIKTAIGCLAHARKYASLIDIAVSPLEVDFASEPKFYDRWSDRRLTILRRDIYR